MEREYTILDDIKYAVRCGTIPVMEAYQRLIVECGLEEEYAQQIIRSLIHQRARNETRKAKKVERGVVRKMLLTGYISQTEAVNTLIAPPHDYPVDVAINFVKQWIEQYDVLLADVS